jgi:DNA polymerase-3 subunit epsilon/oligoribonuclease
MGDRSGGDRVLGVFLDTETNGLNSRVHRILEIAYRVVDLRDGTEVGNDHTIIAQPIEVWEKSDPESLKVNGFTWAEICKGRAAHHVAQNIINAFSGMGIQRKKAVFICQNPSFDRVFFSQLIDSDTQELLNWPYHWLDLASMFWALALNRAKTGQGPLPWETGLSKDLIAAHYHLAAEEKPHRAMNGVDHLLLCYRAVVGFPLHIPK